MFGMKALLKQAGEAKLAQLDRIETRLIPGISLNALERSVVSNNTPPGWSIQFEESNGLVTKVIMTKK